MTDPTPRKPAPPTPGAPKGHPAVHVRRPANKPVERLLDREKWQQLRADAQKYVDLFDQMDQNLAGRMKMLRFIHDLAKIPQPMWEGSLRSLRADHATMVRAVLQRMGSDAGVGKRIRIALERYDDAAQVVQETRAFLSVESTLEAENIHAVLEILNRIGTQESARRRELIADFDLAKVKSKLFLLTTYDLLFKSDPVLNQMFPPIEREANVLKPVSNSQPNGASEKQPRPAPKPVQTLPTPPPQEGLLQGFLKKIKRD